MLRGYTTYLPIACNLNCTTEIARHMPVVYQIIGHSNVLIFTILVWLIHSAGLHHVLYCVLSQLHKGNCMSHARCVPSHWPGRPLVGSNVPICTIFVWLLHKRSVTPQTYSTACGLNCTVGIARHTPVVLPSHWPRTPAGRFKRAIIQYFLVIVTWLHRLVCCM